MPRCSSCFRHTPLLARALAHSGGALQEEERKKLEADLKTLQEQKEKEKEREAESRRKQAEEEARRKKKLEEEGRARQGIVDESELVGDDKKDKDEDQRA